MIWWQAAVLGLVEGVTEFLPISSTGHLILAERLLHLPASDSLTTFTIAIQLGAIVAVVILYLRSSGLPNRRLIKLLACSFVPTAAIGLLVYPLVKNFLLSSAGVTVVALALGGCGLIWLERYLARRPPLARTINDLTWREAGVIGLAQAVAIVPGVSRSASSIVSGLLLGLERTEALRYSFWLAVPTIAAAAGWDLLQSASHLTVADVTPLLIGFAVALTAAYLSMKWLINFVNRETLTPFGFYRIAIATLYALIFWLA